MRVLVVSHYFPAHAGGVEICAGEIARRMAERGHEVTWCASTSEETPDWPGVHAVPMRKLDPTESSVGFPYPLWTPAGLLRLTRFVAQSDVVHIHECLYLASIVAAIAARFRRKPYFVTQQVGAIDYRNSLLRTTQRIANRIVGAIVLSRAARAIFVSRTVRDYFLRFVHFRSAPLIIENGVADVFEPASSPRPRRERPLLLFVGRFVEKKGLHLLRDLVRRFPSCDWIFVGRGPLDPSQWNEPNVRVIAPMPQKELARHYQTSDLVVLPSFGEGFPLVVQEALACGTPALVSTEVAAVLTERPDALYGADRSVDAFAAAIERILGNREELARAASSAAAYARRTWSWPAVVDEYMDVFAHAV